MPKIPRDEQLRLLGLLSAVQANPAASAPPPDAVQERRGNEAGKALDDQALVAACVDLAKRVDVQRFL